MSAGAAWSCALLLGGRGTAAMRRAGTPWGPWRLRQRAAVQPVCAARCQPLRGTGPHGAGPRARRWGVQAAEGRCAVGRCTAPVGWRPLGGDRWWLATRRPWWQRATPWALRRPSRGGLTSPEGPAASGPAPCPGAGNTSDPVTVPEQVQTLKTRFGITEMVFVGDRGMVQAKGKRVLTTAGFRSITALTTPQVRRLLHEQILRAAWFTSHVHEVVHGSVRLVLRRSAATRQREARRRADQLAQLQALIAVRHACGRAAKRAKPETGLRTLQAWVKRSKLDACVSVSLHEGHLLATLDAAAQAEATLLDGCSVLETDVPQTALDAQAVHDRYRDLQEVEQDVRTMKTGLLEVRPLFVRQAPRPGVGHDVGLESGARNAPCPRGGLRHHR